MLEKYFSAPKALADLRSGLSGPYMDGFAEALEQDSYSPLTAVRYLRAAAHFGHFLQRRSGSVAKIDSSTLDAFSRHLPRCHCPLPKSRSVSVRPYQVGPQRCSRRSAIGGCETQFGFTVFKGLGWWAASYRVGARQYGSGASPRRVCARRRLGKPGARHHAARTSG